MRAFSVRDMFMRCMSQYEKLIRRKAFLDQYEQYSIFGVRSISQISKIFQSTFVLDFRLREGGRDFNSGDIFFICHLNNCVLFTR